LTFNKIPSNLFHFLAEEWSNFSQVHREIALTIGFHADPDHYNPTTGFWLFDLLDGKEDDASVSVIRCSKCGLIAEEKSHVDFRG